MSGGTDPRAFAVVDLGFGDAGKGLLTDALVRRTGARLVVRFNGGAQAAHNVVTPEGRHHTFSQLGSGTFVGGVVTFLSRHVVVHPTALAVEAAVIAGAGVPDALVRTRISERALVVTPWHQAIGRLRELCRGSARHGSCGLGAGETTRDAVAHPQDAIRAADLRVPDRLVRAAERARERLRAELDGLDPPRAETARVEVEALEDPSLPPRWAARARVVASCVVPDQVLGLLLARSGAVVFEGAHGLLLDEEVGFHPYVTRSSCTAENARALLAEAAPGRQLTVLGVLRTHAVRHGPGPLPSEADELRTRIREHNTTGAWQGPVRYGWFDAVLARYASSLASDVHALAVTHVDAIGRGGPWSFVSGYRCEEPVAADLAISEGTRVADLVVAPHPTIERQSRLASLLLRCRAEAEPAPSCPSSYVSRIEALVGRRLSVVSRGPRASDVEFLDRRLLGDS